MSSGGPTEGEPGNASRGRRTTQLLLLASMFAWTGFWAAELLHAPSVVLLALFIVGLPFAVAVPIGWLKRERDLGRHAEDERSRG